MCFNALGNIPVQQTAADCISPSILDFRGVFAASDIGRFPYQMPSDLGVPSSSLPSTYVLLPPLQVLRPGAEAWATVTLLPTEAAIFSALQYLYPTEFHW